MNKTIRNTVFTVAVLAMTGAGVEWNEEIAATRNPIAIGESVLAEQSTRHSNDFPISVDISRKVVRLGQYQNVSIQTQPFAELDIVTVGPEGNFDRPETFRAVSNETGRYTFRFRLNDFRDLGAFSLTVKARIGSDSAEATQYFILQPWSGTADEENGHIYPLVP